MHGWLIDPEEKEMYSLIAPLSYNQCVEKLIAMSLLLSPEETAEGSPARDSVRLGSTVQNIEGQRDTKESGENTPNRHSKRFSSPIGSKVATLRREDIKKEDEEKILREGSWF